jgi:hypothetical protein
MSFWWAQVFCLPDWFSYWHEVKCICDIIINYSEWWWYKIWIWRSFLPFFPGALLKIKLLSQYHNMYLKLDIVILHVCRAFAQGFCTMGRNWWRSLIFKSTPLIKSISSLSFLSLTCVQNVIMCYFASYVGCHLILPLEKLFQTYVTAFIN